jgi:uncharacterized LabA/DUF88 family protein
MIQPTPQKANVYIDGFNFYNGLVASNWKQYFWLDMVSLANEMLGSLAKKPTLNNVYYFSAPPYMHVGKEKRQRRFFTANQQNSQFKLVLGHHKDKSKNCYSCGTKIAMSEEKQTDVNIALKMLGCAAKDECNLSILVSGDTDMIPIIKAIKDIKSAHQVMIFFPPSRKTHEMIQYADGWRDLLTLEPIFKKSIFPEKVELKVPEGTNTHIEIPLKWKPFMPKV